MQSSARMKTKFGEELASRSGMASRTMVVRIPNVSRETLGGSREGFTGGEDL